MKVQFIILLGLLALLSCKKDDPKPVKFGEPSSVTLIFPFENSECNEGTNITDTQSTILFEWFASDFTDEYELHVTNLDNGEQAAFISSDVKVPVVLQRGTPYSWFVVSKANDTDSTAQSDVWKFYNAGDGIISYAPFPAEAIFPKMAATVSAASGSITLEWEGADVDDDIIGYDLYFGTSPDPVLLIAELQSTTHSVSVTSGTIYYWHIVSKDATAHESISNTFQFKVE